MLNCSVYRTVYGLEGGLLYCLVLVVLFCLRMVYSEHTSALVLDSPGSSSWICLVIQSIYFKNEREDQVEVHGRRVYSGRCSQP